MVEAGLFVLGHLLVFGFLAATCYVLGRTLAGSLAFESAGEKIAVSTAMGLAVLGQLVFFLGLAGILEKNALLLLLAAVHVSGWRAWREAAAAIGEEAKRPGSRRRWGQALVVAVLLAPFAILAMYPPTAFDATAYHLPQAKVFAATGGLPVVANLVQPVFPAHGESLFAAMLLLADDVSAQGVELLAGLLTAALLAVWARRRFGGHAGAMAAGLYLGSPAIVYLLGSAYIDPSHALFAVGSVFALDRYRQPRAPGFLVVAAVFAGAADSTKYLGLLFVGVVGLAALIALGRRSDRLFAAVALVILLLFVGTCHGRIAKLSGNPVHPYFQRVFGTSAWTIPEADRASARLQHSQSLIGLAVDEAVDVTRLPWDLAFNRQRYEANPPISPWYAALLPIVIYGAIRSRAVRSFVLLAAAYAYLVWLLPRNTRYLFPALALASVAWSGSAEILRAAAARRWALVKKLSYTPAFLLLLPGILYAGRRFWISGPLPTNAGGREKYLARMFPAYPALAYLNRVYGQRFTVYVLGAPNLDYYSQGVFFGEYNGPASYRRIFPRDHDPAILRRNLRILGVDHLLVPAALPPRYTTPAAWTGFDRAFRLEFGDAGARIYALENEPGPAAIERDALLLPQALPPMALVGGLRR